jgi:hypothetical protein
MSSDVLEPFQVNILVLMIDMINLFISTTVGQSIRNVVS